MRVCSVDGCEKRHEAHGFCAMHYERWRRRGDAGLAESERNPITVEQCIVVGCTRPPHARNLCSSHVARLRRHGDAMCGGQARDHRPLEHRFFDRAEIQANGCWLWTGSIVLGYGRVRSGGETQGAHRAAYELVVGPIPADMTIDHLCHTNDPSCPGGDVLCLHRRCVNPTHMEVVTLAENSRRGNQHRWAST